MKNIHIIPTDKPSRLILQNTKLLLSKYKEVNEGFSEFNQNIYITSDEEIKEGFIGWFICPHGLKKCVGTIVINNEVYLLDYLGNTDRGIWCSKIIITDNEDLINDGVQPIDDKFLEWFVKNPSCESVEVERVVVYDDNNNGSGEIFHSNRKFAYEIIIPREEDEQEESLITLKKEVINGLNELLKLNNSIGNFGKPQEESKQETLEEAANKYVEDFDLSFYDTVEAIPVKELGKKDFIEGAKWQAERMYSEEDMRKAFEAGELSKEDDINGDGETLFDEWFEQHKNKL